MHICGGTHTGHTSQVMWLLISRCTSEIMPTTRPPSSPTAAAAMPAALPPSIRSRGSPCGPVAAAATAASTSCRRSPSSTHLHVCVPRLLKQHHQVRLDALAAVHTALGADLQASHLRGQHSVLLHQLAQHRQRHADRVLPVAHESHALLAQPPGVLARRHAVVSLQVLLTHLQWARRGARGTPAPAVRV